MSIKIDKNIPLPTRSNVGGKQKYPFDKMNVGDSFWYEKKKKQSTIYSCLTYYNAIAKNKISIKTKTEIINGKRGLRVWRIK